MQRRKILLTGVGLMGAIACGNQNNTQGSQSVDRLSDKSAEFAFANSGQLFTPAQYLKLLKPPKFKRGHTLPPLTRFGWTIPFETRVELADRWGYALDWGGSATPENVARISDPTTEEAKIIALVASYPNRYKLSVGLIRDLPDVPESTWLHNDRGKLVDGKKVWSPEAPDVALKAVAELRIAPLRQITKRVPISVILNGGEYGLNTIDSIAKLGVKDPKVLVAKGNREWFDYVSDRKAYQESFITKAIQKLTPHRQIYVYYPTDSNPHRNRYGDWNQWCFDYKYMRTISDLPSSSTYFKEYNTGWNGDMDILTEVLNSVGQQIKIGDPLSYNWVCSGWMHDGKTPIFGEIDRYLGFLKCYYTAGMIGGIAGYFDLPANGGFAATFPADQPPNWLQQMTALARVHAQFSHLERYLRQGDLLPGPNQHRWSKDTPAYEFPAEDGDVRVLARKDKRKSAWLITAWAAAGNPRKVTVILPQLGRFQVLARPSGSIYTAEIFNNKPKFNWIDRHEL